MLKVALNMQHVLYFTFFQNLILIMTKFKKIVNQKDSKVVIKFKEPNKRNA